MGQKQKILTLDVQKGEQQHHAAASTSPNDAINTPTTPLQQHHDIMSFTEVALMAAIQQ